MKRIKVKATKAEMTCSKCGARVLKSKGSMSKGKFYCANCK